MVPFDATSLYSTTFLGAQPSAEQQIDSCEAEAATSNAPFFGISEYSEVCPAGKSSILWHLEPVLEQASTVMGMVQNYIEQPAPHQPQGAQRVIGLHPRLPLQGCTTYGDAFRGEQPVHKDACTCTHTTEGRPAVVVSSTSTPQAVVDVAAPPLQRYPHVKNPHR